MIMFLIGLTFAGGVSLFLFIFDRVYTHKEFFDDTKSIKRKEKYFKKNGAKVLHGSVITFYKNGKMKSCLSYKLGKLNGVQDYFNSDGKLEKREAYLEGEFISEIK